MFQGALIMSNKTRFVVQQFVLFEGRAMPGEGSEERDAATVIRRADNLKDHASGVVALKIITDAQTGQILESTILARHGDVPAAFVDQPIDLLRSA